MSLEAHAPLAGTVVIELGTSVAAPIGTLIFAELGAQVIKIENPKGGDDARLWGPPFVDGNSPTFHAINRNKMSAAIDLKDERNGRHCATTFSRAPTLCCRICGRAWSRVTASMRHLCAPRSRR